MGYVPYVGFATHCHATVIIHLYLYIYKKMGCHRHSALNKCVDVLL